jgi:hypothetical protein
MYKLRLTLVLLTTAFFISGNAQAQHIYGAFSAGINLSQVDGDEVYGFHKVGLNIGPSVIIPFGKNKNWSITMELLYSQLGARQKSEYGADSTIKDSSRIGLYDGYKLNLNYIQIPVLIHFTDKKVISGGVGFLYGQRVGYKELEEYNDLQGWIPSTYGAFNNYDLEVIADVRIRLWQRLWINARYSYSVIPIRERTYKNIVYNTTWTRQQYNNVITLRLTYIINEVLIKKPAKKSTSKKK